MVKRGRTTAIAVGLSVVLAMFGGTAAWAGTGSHNWGGQGVGAKSAAFTVPTTTSYFNARLNTGAVGSWYYSNPTYGINEVQLQLQRQVNGAYSSVGNHQAATGVYMNWGSRVNGSYRFQINGWRSATTGTWMGATSNAYIATGVSPYYWG